MKLFLLILAAAYTVEGTSPGLRVKIQFSLTTLFTMGKSLFFELPPNVTAAVDAGWTEENSPTSYLSEYLKMYCYSDKLMCLYFDDSEYVAGLQYGIEKSSYSNNVFDWITRGYLSWNASVDGVNKEFWTTRKYFISEEELSISKEDRVAARNSSRLIQYDSIWFTGINGTIDKVPISETDLVANTRFTEQNCVIWMGTHYYKNMSTTTECVAEQMYPWFLLVNNGQVVGSAPTNVGQITVSDDQRDWYEASNKLVVEYTIPNGPECLYDLGSDPGFVTTHIYYVDDPWNIYC